MINGYEIRENTVTPNSVFLFLLKADEDGRKKIEEKLSAFCKLTKIKVKGFDYVFELSGITDDSMLDKFKNQVEFLSSPVKNVAQTFGNPLETETITLNNTSTMPIIEATIKKEKKDYSVTDILSEPTKVGPSMPSLDLSEKKEMPSLKLAETGFPISQERPVTELKDLSFNHNLSVDEMTGVLVEGNSLKIEKTMPSVQQNFPEKPASPAAEQTSMPQAEEEVSEIEEATKTLVSFTPEEMKDVAISIERPRERKNIFGGLFNKVKNIFNSKKTKAEKVETVPQVEEKIKKEVEQEVKKEVKKEVKEIEKEIEKEVREEIKQEVKEEKIAPEQPKKKFSLFKKAKEIKEKVENSDVVKQAQEKAKELKKEVQEELKEENPKEAPVKEEVKNPFQDLGSGIIAKKGLLSNEPVDDIIQKEREDLMGNPITAKLQVDDIFAAETVYNFYADQPESKNENFEQNHQKEATIPVTPKTEVKKQTQSPIQEQEIKPQTVEKVQKQDDALNTEVGNQNKNSITPIPVTETIKNIFDKTETNAIPSTEKTEKTEEEKHSPIIVSAPAKLQKQEDKEIKVQIPKEEIITEPQAEEIKKEETKQEEIKVQIPEEKPAPEVKAPAKEEKVAPETKPEEQKLKIQEPGETQKVEPKKVESKLENIRDVFDPEKTDNRFSTLDTEVLKSVFKEREQAETITFFETKKDISTESKTDTFGQTAESETSSAQESKQEAKFGMKQLPEAKPEEKQDIVKKEEPKQEIKEEKVNPVREQVSPKTVEQKQQAPKEVKEKVPNTVEPNLKKEKINMQEQNNEDIMKHQGEEHSGTRRDFTSKNDASRHEEKIDHTLHVGTPAKGAKYRNYPIEMPLIPTYTFANMDISPMRFAHAMAMATLENLGTGNNPFLLQGVSGTGKTHFLHAMGYEISKKIPQSKILFTNGVRLSRGIQYSLEKGEKDKLDAFFKGMEVLIIDDVHLTAVNEHNREYISKVLNYFFKNKKQIIFSSKYPPESLQRFEELVNFKFALGTITELKIPNKAHFSRLTEKIVTAANLELSENQVQEFFCSRCSSLGEVARDVKRVKVLSRRIESSGINMASSENILKVMTGINGENEESEIVKKNFEDITALTKNSDDKWGNFGFFFPASQIDKFRWVAFASQEAAKELGIKGGFNYALKSAYSTEHIISAAFKIANICDVKGLKGAVILGPSLTEVKEPIRDNFYDILTHMLEVMMIRCGTINFENIKKPSAYVKMLGDILK